MMAYRNGAPYGTFTAPNGNPPMMNHQNRHYGPPRFNNSCPWRPQPERPNFNINRFMHPPHMVQRPEFGAGNIFGQETSGGSHENFPFSQQNNRGQHNTQGQQVNGNQNTWGQQVNGHQNTWGQQVNGHQNPQGQLTNGQNFQGPQTNAQNIQGPQTNGQNIQGPQTNGQKFQGPPANGQHYQGHQFNGQHFQGHQANGQHFQGHPGRGRGFTRGHHGGQGFRGGFRGGFNNAQQNPSNKAKKKEKVDKRDLPENNAFFCDICDRGFKVPEKFKEHTDSHIKCSYKDCPFIAAPKLVQLHMRMQHSTGLAKKVWSMESEEDIKKWREERKRNFPTAENVTRKLKERAEKIARGEVLETRQFGKMGRGRGRNRHRGRGKGRWKNHDDGECNTADGSDDDDSPPEEVKIIKSTVNDDEDNSRMVVDQDVNSSDKSGTPTAKLQKAVEMKAELPTTTSGDGPEASLPNMESAADTSGNSLSLLASYGDSSDSGEVSEEESEASFSASDVSTKKVDPSTVSPSTPSTNDKSAEDLPHPLSATSPFIGEHHKINLSPSKNGFDNTIMSVATNSICDSQKGQPHNTATIISIDKQNCSHNSSCSNQDNISNKATHTRDISNNHNQEEKQAVGGKRRSQSRQKGEPLAKKNKKEPVKQQLQKYTLLQKLLAPDMRKERNKILQCVHYIVKNRFFEKECTVNKTLLTSDHTS